MRTEAGSSECRSLGSPKYPSGRFPKVSIGITVEGCLKMGSGKTKEDGAALPTWERVSSSQVNVLEENRVPGIAEASKGKLPAKDLKASAWFSTRSVCHETPTTETMQIFANRASVLQSDDVVHKKIDTVAFGKRREKDGNSEKVEEVAFTTMEEMHAPYKGTGREHPEGMNKNSNETLRIKLWEILGTASLNKQNMNSLNLGNRTLDINFKRETQMDKSEKLKQNPDMIEIGSEIPIQTIRRPVTRSLAKKKAPSTTGNKLQGQVSSGKRPLFSSSSGSKPKLDGKNIVSFEEGERKEQSLEQAVRFKGKRSKQKRTRIEPRRNCFPRQLASDKSVQTESKEQTLPSPDKASPQSKEKTHSASLTGHGQKDILQTTTEVPDVNHHSQTAAPKHLANPFLTGYAEAHEYNGSSFMKRKTRSWEHLNRSPVPNDAYQHKSVGSPSVARSSNPLDDFQSPAFAMNASTHTPSPRSEQPNEAFCSPVPVKNRMLARKVYSSNSLGNSRRKHYGSDAETETSDGTREIRETGTPHAGGKTETEKQPSVSPVDDQDTEGSEANNFFKKGCRQTDKLFSDADSPKISQLTLHHRKRVCSRKIEKLCKINLSSPSPIGTYRTEETSGSHESSEQYPEDSLAGAVCQLALVLERFKSKIKSHTVKKSSEILSAAAEKIHLQLQDIETHIQADVGNLISTGSSQRKHMESKFQGQQGKLKFIHDKFKEEINKHLLDCRSTLEEFGAYQTELKGCADQQKASHRKLLLQVEEAMEAQLNDAETSISTIHKEARKRMNCLKHVLKELLAEGMIF
ncbi:meiosis-specific protein PAIR3-like [Phoenix dactylifera]|uniref:Meiosis-specific protein PAIR3-like n=1 Tax=Phoenix dactylifera TaxID=42345 RepID=A0A8B9ADI2_PHODC|nr:meiosis-specific protein PAIR3-like [Phoenix dactylifera]